MDADYEALFEMARMSVCPCWYYDLVDDGSVDESDLRAVIINPSYFHYANQHHNAVSDDEFQQELRACPAHDGGISTIFI
jgi:hypothetical protein